MGRGPVGKTNAARRLEELGLAYEVRTYAVGAEHLDAATVAAAVGLPPAQVFKTLVARGPQAGVCFAVVPADAELDLKALARLAGEKHMALVPLKEVQPLTGYVRGGVTALAARKAYPVFADASLAAQPEIAVSAGQRGMQLVLAPRDYLAATGAVTGPLARRA